MRPYSLRKRLLLWLFLATAVLGVLAMADTWREALRTAQTVSDRVLFGSALAIAERVTVDEAGGLEVDIPYSSLEMLTSAAQDRVFYRVDGPTGVFLSGYSDLPLAVPPPGEIAFSDSVFGSVPIRMVTLSREISSGDFALTFQVAVAESTLSRQALARTILLRSALRLAALAAGVVGIVWVTVTWALRPLGALGARIALRTPDDLAAIPLESPQEVAPLVTAINSFMDRLQTALSALRHFTGNASHQLRTPLSVVRTQLALIERSTDPRSAKDAVLKAQFALQRAERVLAQLLVLARVDAAESARSLLVIDLAEAARAMTAEMVPLALQAGIDLGYDGNTTAMGRAEPVLLDEVLKNLIENAISYAGRGAMVTVCVQTQDSGAVIVSVEDNGPGLPQNVQPVRSTTLQRGGKRDGDGKGYGLGLAICAEIAALFGAQLHLGKPDHNQGLRASLTFGADTL